MKIIRHTDGTVTFFAESNCEIAVILDGTLGNIVKNIDDKNTAIELEKLGFENTPQTKALFMGFSDYVYD